MLQERQIYNLINKTGIAIEWYPGKSLYKLIIKSFNGDTLHIADFLTVMFDRIGELYPSEHICDRDGDPYSDVDIKFVSHPVKCQLGGECYHYACT